MTLIYLKLFNYFLTFSDVLREYDEHGELELYGEIKKYFKGRQEIMSWSLT